MRGTLFAGLLLITARWWVPASAGWQENVRPKISAVRSKSICLIFYFFFLLLLLPSVRVQLTVNSTDPRGNVVALLARCNFRRGGLYARGSSVRTAVSMRSHAIPCCFAGGLFRPVIDEMHESYSVFNHRAKYIVCTTSFYGVNANHQLKVLIVGNCRLFIDVHL